MRRRGSLGRANHVFRHDVLLTRCAVTRVSEWVCVSCTAPSATDSGVACERPGSELSSSVEFIGKADSCYILSSIAGSRPIVFYA